MSKFKSTKHALVMSLLALVVCISMLVGSTFAWFTDSVTSSNNIIKSGNLDMKLSYKPYGAENTKWTEVDANTVIFGKDALYEPGYTEAVWLKVENAGSLAFKYDLAVNIASEKAGLNQAGKEFNLSDYLEVKYLNVTSTDMENKFYTTRESLNSFNFGGVANSGITSFKDDIAVIKNGVAFSKNDTAMAGLDCSYVLVIINMPTTVGNEANHNGKNIPEINFTLTAMATQLPYEKDSFGSDYDKDAEYIEYDHIIKSAAELKDAFDKGGNILLADDVTLDETLYVGKDLEVYLNLNGKSITVEENATAEYLFYPKMGSKLTIDGDGTVNLGKNGLALIIPCGDVTINSGTFVRELDENMLDDAYPLISGTKWAEGLGNTVINGGYFDGGYYDANADFANFSETADDVVKRGNSKDKNATRVALKNNIIAVINLSANNIVVNGGTFVGANPAWGDEGCALPTTPDYLRPWSYYQGTFIPGQQIFDDKIELPDGYTITEGKTAEGIPTYTLTCTK